jgi:dienelactone hydrolase
MLSGKIPCAMFAFCALLGAQTRALAEPSGTNGLERISLSSLSAPPLIDSAFGTALQTPRAPVTQPAGLPPTAPDLNEQVVRIPLDTPGTSLEATLFKPDGPGPFPLVIFNHGKNPGDAHNQPRSRPLSFAREFVRRGYAVVAPNRTGFAGSDGEYTEKGCDVTDSALAQASDVTRTIDYFSHQPFIDARRIIVAGMSHGGLISLAFGTKPTPGVLGVLNFSGGLRQDACSDWQTNLTDAFGALGALARIPSLWLYGDNDDVWTPSLITRLRNAYAAHGAPLRFVDFGHYKDDAHRIVMDRDGVAVWWPYVGDFLARLGLPTAIRYAIAEPQAPAASGYASLDAVDAIPYVGPTGRDGYRRFLQQYPHRAFAVSTGGAWAWAEGGDNPLALALDRCAHQNAGACQLYAVDDRVVWRADAPATAAIAPPAASPAPALASR